MKKGIAVFMAVALAAGAGGGVYYQYIYKGAGADGRVSSQSENAVYVDSVASLAGLGSGSGQIARYAGIVEPQETWSAKLENEAKIKETYVKEGDMVKVGDKLFPYDLSEKQDTLAQSQIDLERKQYTLDTEKRELEELEKAKKKATGDQIQTVSTQILQQENTIKQCEYDIQAMELSIQQLEKDLKEADVFSELEGVVRSVTNPNSSTNSYYNSSDDSNSYITIMAVGEYRVKGTVNEQNMRDISVGENMIAYSRVDSSQYWTGTITQIKTDGTTSNQNNDYGSDSDSTNASTNYPFYVVMDSSDGLMLGQHVYLEVDAGQTEKKEGIWLPEYYFTSDENGDYWVWAASSKNQLEKRSVQFGEYDPELGTYQIVSGLDAEDYIAQASSFMEEGLPVIYNDYSAESGNEDYEYDDEDYGDDDTDWEDDELTVTDDEDTLDADYGLNSSGGLGSSSGEVFMGVENIDMDNED